MSPLQDLDSPSVLPPVVPGWRFNKIRASHLPSSTCSSTINAAPLPSHNIKPGRRRPLGFHCYTTPLRTSTLLLLVLGILVTLCGISEAGIIEKNKYLESRGYAEPGQYEELLFDTRPQPVPPGELNLWRRQNTGGDLFGSTDAGPSSTTVVASSSSVEASSRASFPSTTATPISSATNVNPAASSLMSAAPASTDLPKPFDTSLSSNFTSSSCPEFFSSFLNNATFKQCLPLSLLLQVCPAPLVPIACALPRCSRTPICQLLPESLIPIASAPGAQIQSG